MAGAIGCGIIAGLAGTAVMTVAQMIEMKITGRPPSDTPYKAVSKVLGIEAKSDEDKEKLSNIIHWMYGSAWGIPRGLLAASGAEGAAGTGAHFAAVWGTEIVMLPSLGVAEPITKWKPKAIVQDILFHAVYAVTVGFVADALTSRPAKKRKKQK
ncbi:hypothetical protein I2I11_20000 [Pontibacter sp. 172403-2]|nr:hypothetical protein [Pontibacter sp. 172403-2]